MPNPMQLAAALGKGGDSVVGHLTPGEDVIPLPVQKAHPEIVQALAQALQEMGASIGQYQVGSPQDKVNPQTGMPQFDAEDSAGNNMSDPNNSGGGGYSVGANDTGGSNGYSDGSMSHDNDTTPTEQAAFGPNYGNGNGGGSYSYNNDGSWTYNDGFDAPTSPTHGFGFMGFSPASRSNPFSGQTQHGFGFNPGAAIGGIAGSAFGGIGGLLGGALGGRLTDTQYSFADPRGAGFGEQNAPQTQPNDERNGGVDLMAMMQPQQVRRG